jgi:alpha-L-rhamnosidase
MFGDISAWMFAYLAGIRPHPDHAGFKRFLIHPHLPAHLDSVRAEYHSPYGVIRSAWRRGECGRISLEVTVPVNTTTEIWLPTTNAGSIMESGMPIQQRMTIVPSDSSGIPVVTLGSGDYTFEIE